MERLDIGIPKGYWSAINCKGDLPRPKSGHSAVQYKGREMYVFGGFDGATVLNELGCLDLYTQTWTKIHGESNSGPNMPSPRCSHAAAINKQTGCMYIFGGSGQHFGYSNKADLFKYTICTKTWNEVLCIGNAPSARYGHSMLYINGCLLVFGGSDGFTFFNDLFLIDLSNLLWQKVKTTGTPPPVRYKHSALCYGDKMLIIGGGDTNSHYGDVWTLDSTFIWSQISNNIVPDGRSCHTAEICGNEIYLFGGGLAKRYADLWKYCLTKNKWTEVAQKGPDQPPRNFHSSVLCDEYIVLFGGNLNQDLNNRSNESLVYRLADYLPVYQSPILQLEEWIDRPGAHADTRLIFEDGELYSQQSLLKFRIPLLHQFIELFGSQKLIRVPCSVKIGRALCKFIYKDELDLTLNIMELLNLLSVATKYGISSLMTKLILYFLYNVSHENVIQVANYLSQNSMGGILHRNELRANRAKYINEQEQRPGLSKMIASEALERLTEKLYFSYIKYIVEFYEDLKRKGIYSSQRVESIVNIDIQNRIKNKNDKKIKEEEKLSIIDEENSLHNSLKLLYNDDQSKDLTLSAEGGEIKVHSFMMLAGSIFFRSLILNPFAESQENKIQIDTIPIEALIPLIKYIYLGSKGIKEISIEEQSQLVPYADYFQLTNPGLKDNIGASIDDIISNENVFEYLNMAHQMQASVMKKKIIEFFIENYAELVESEEMSSLPVEILVELHRWRAKI